MVTRINRYFYFSKIFHLLVTYYKLFSNLYLKYLPEVQIYENRGLSRATSRSSDQLSQGESCRSKTCVVVLLASCPKSSSDASTRAGSQPHVATPSSGHRPLDGGNGWVLLPREKEDLNKPLSTWCSMVTGSNFDARSRLGTAKAPSDHIGCFGLSTCKLEELTRRKRPPKLDTQ